MCRRHFFTPFSAQFLIRAARWSICEWTLPSERSPIKWIVALPAAGFDIRRFHISVLNIEPDFMAPFTSLAPCSNTRPAPMALWPTSELPISSSDGSPTAVPCAFSFVNIQTLIRWSRRGVLAWKRASPSSPLPSPTPSIITRTTGPRREILFNFFKVYICFFLFFFFKQIKQLSYFIYELLHIRRKLRE